MEDMISIVHGMKAAAMQKCMKRRTQSLLRIHLHAQVPRRLVDIACVTLSAHFRGTPARQ